MGFCQVSQYKVPHLFASTLRLSHTCGQVLFGFGWLVVSTLNWLVLVGFIQYIVIYQLKHIVALLKLTVLVGFGWLTLLVEKSVLPAVFHIDV